MATKRARRKRRRRTERGEVAPGTGSAGLESGESWARADADRRRAGPARRRVPGERPQALWGSFPLSELVVLVALILLVAGFFAGGQRGAAMMIVGLLLGALAGVELAAREHFAGYRSHNLLLAGAAGMSVFGLLYAISPLSPPACAVAGAIAFAGSAWLLAMAFSRRSGGALYRFKGG